MVRNIQLMNWKERGVADYKFRDSAVSKYEIFGNKETYYSNAMRKLKLTYATKSGIRDIEDPSWAEIDDCLTKLNINERSHVILDNGIDGYIQCAGSTLEMMVEYRMTRNNAFKHYMLGFGGNRSPLGITWVHLKTGVGQIAIQREEVLTGSDGIRIFRSFHNAEGIPDDFTKRNVTKLHK